MTSDGASDTREARLAEALRANLRKRKAQGKVRDAGRETDEPDRVERDRPDDTRET